MGGVDTYKTECSFYEVFYKSYSPSTVPVQQGTTEELGELLQEWTGFFAIVELEPYMLKAYSRKTDNVLKNMPAPMLHGT